MESTSSAYSPTHEIRASPGKGLGVFANRFIPQGSKIIIEEPLITVAMPDMIQGYGFRIADMMSDIASAFESLTATQQGDVLSLHDFRYPGEDEAGQEQNHLLTIFRSNAYNTGDDKIGLFPKTARINHSCRPNAGNWWSGSTQRRIIYAMRDIAEGEEIKVSYIPLLKSRGDRQARLKQYGFTCDCEACEEGSEAGDKMRVRIGDHLEELEGKVGRKSQKGEVSRKRVEKARRLVKMVEAEGLGDYVARAYHLLAIFCDHVGDLKEARQWAAKEQEALGWAEKESEEAIVSARFLETLKNK